MLRPLGTTGLSIAPLVFGGNVLGWTADRATSFRLLDAFIDGGGTMIDTADIYSAFAPGLAGGESETVIGEWLAQGDGRRDRVQIATKVGLMPHPGGCPLDRAHIEAAIDGSLARLRTDHVELYFAHKDDAETPLEDTLSAFDGLVKAGKVGAIGASNHSADRIATALDISARNGLAAFGVIEPLYNLLERDAFEGSLQQVAIERELGVIPFFGLASGFLTGKYRRTADAEGKARGPWIDKYLNDRGFALVDALVAVADDARATPAQVALAWLAARPGVTAPIASATSIAQLDELLAAMRLQLSPAQIAALDTTSAS
ncbi:aldo/keto reductase [Sphingomonas sp. 1P06PA]|uniref:aldo/keto reductase n=1 Tax=Sphingomonas sp. 1P06PA TaxID=554121 RepID=UPI0039A6B3BA